MDVRGEEMPVLIVGAGPCGLLSSILLSRAGIRSLVVEKRARVGTLPRARGITARSVEILTQLGLGPEMDEISVGPPWLGAFVYTETMAGRVIGKVPSRSLWPSAFSDVTPADYKVSAQDRIDPMLYRKATESPLAEIVFDTEVLGYEAIGEEAVATTLRCGDGVERSVRSQFLIAADGARSSLRRMAGIGWQGRTDLAHFVNAHVRGDFSVLTAGREGSLIWTTAPGRHGVFQPLDGKDRWAVQIQYDPSIEDAAEWDADRVRQAVIDRLGVEGDAVPEFEVLRSYTYALSAMIAERFHEGRLILVGDAAHQIAPYGGFGMNTGLQTAHNAVWRIRSILQGHADLRLLDGFDAERIEVARRAHAFGMQNAQYVAELMQAVKRAEDEQTQAEILARSGQYGTWLGLDLGMHYETEDGSFVPDDAASPLVDDPVQDFVPHAKPGHRAPHFWAATGGERVSSIMLFDGDFHLLAGPDGQAWLDAADTLRDETTLPSLTSWRVCPSGDLEPETNFCELYGIEADGAVLVRPDGHVAFRSVRAQDEPQVALERALLHVLARSRSTGL